MPASPGDKYMVTGEYNTAPTGVPSTCLMLLAGTKRAWLTELNIGSKTATALAGAKISVGRPTTQGTTGAVIVPQPVDAAAPACLMSAWSATTQWTVEPTQPSVYLYSIGLNAVASEIWTPPEPILIGAATRLAVRIEADASATKVQWVITATFQE